MSALDDLKAAGIECPEAEDYARCLENIEMFPCDECSLHKPEGSPQCAEHLADALARIAIRLSGELAAAKAHWDAAASIAREREAERDRLRSCLEETESAKTEMRAERDRLQHIIDCANTPLMMDVLRERDVAREELHRARNLAVGLEQEVERLREILKTAEEDFKVILGEIATSREVNCEF